MENKNWQDEAVKDSGIKVPEWELEPTGAEQKENMEASVEAEPSVAEKRLEELAAEVKEVAPENLEQKSAQVETMRAEIAEMAKPEQKPVEREPLKATIIAPKEISLEDIRPGTPKIDSGYGRRPYVNPYSFERKAVKEASGGLIEYVPSSKQNKFGYEFEGSRNIPLEKLQKLEANLEAAEREKFQEVSSYLKVPEKSFGAKWGEDLKLNDARSFEGALDAKAMHNEKIRKNIAFSTAATSVGVGLAGSMGAAALGASAAVVSGAIFTGGGILVGGGLLWAGKKIWDSYKEKKAVKNFMTASVAQNVRRSLKNTP